MRNPLSKLQQIATFSAKQLAAEREAESYTSRSKADARARALLLRVARFGEKIKADELRDRIRAGEKL